MKAVSFYLKEVFITMMYLVIFAALDLGVLCIDDSAMWLKYLLCGVCLVCFIGIVGLMFFKEGESAVKVRRGNDLNREQIIKTGREYPINTVEEYKWWKGFYIGFWTCIPVILLMLLNFLFGLNDPTNGQAGGVAALLYIVVFSFFMTNSQVKIAPSQYYFTLLIIPVLVLTIGIGYILGAKKAERDYAKIQERKRAIHGDKI